MIGKLFSSYHNYLLSEMVLFLYQMVRHYISIKVVRIGGGILAHFSLHRTWRCCWALLASLESKGSLIQYVHTKKPGALDFP